MTPSDPAEIPSSTTDDPATPSRPSVPGSPTPGFSSAVWDPDANHPMVVPIGLEPFVQAGVLGAAEVHVARILGRVSGDDRTATLLGAAMATRAPRRQHVCADLGAVDLLVVDRDDQRSVEVSALPWPDLDRWLQTLADSPMVAVRDPADVSAPDDAGGEAKPLTLAGRRLYLDRLWRDERLVARRLRELAALTYPVDPVVLGGSIATMFRDGVAPDRQRLAAATALSRHLVVVAGGPGTGKTTTVARILALLDELAITMNAALPHVALAAPTGKAAARLTESLHEAASIWATTRGGDDPTVARLREHTATTIHRLLGPRADRRGRFVHHRGQPLPHDVIIVDETSMVSLPLIARLLDAVRHDARLVMLGDPEQLASVEAGSVLGDIVGDVTITANHVSAPMFDTLHVAAGANHVAGLTVAQQPTTLDDAIVVLDRVHRFRDDSGIAAVAAAIQAGDQDAAIEGLRQASDITWIDRAPDRVDEQQLAPLRTAIVEVAGDAMRSAEAGDAIAALAALDQLRVLCAHRRGPAGVADWVVRIEQWLQDALPDHPVRGRWYVGRPVLVTRNDPRRGLANGDTGIVVRGDDDRPVVALEGTDPSTPRRLAPTRLPDVETVHAMTVHKSQGSQFAHVVLVLPDAGSPLLTREMLYTALTRGRRQATVLGTEAALRTAVQTRATRASGLRDALRSVHR